MARITSGVLRLWLGLALVTVIGCGEKQSITPVDVQSAASAVPAVLSVALNPSSVSAGATSTGTVTLTAAAPAGGTAVGVSSNNTSVATVPPNVTVAVGNTSATFTVTTHPVASDDWAAISATAGQVTQTAVILVSPSGLTSSTLSISPTLIAGGATATGTATLTGAPPAGGAVVTLTKGHGDDRHLAVPASVTVAAGATTATFAVTAKTIPFALSVLISASFGGVTRSMWVTVTEPAPTGRQLTSFTVAANPVIGGQPVQGTVTLASAVGAATTVTLTSTDVSVAAVPASVTVPFGVASASFTITTSPVTGSGFAVLNAQAGGITRSVNLTTLPVPTGPTLVSVTLFPLLSAAADPQPAG